MGQAAQVCFGNSLRATPNEKEHRLAAPSLHGMIPHESSTLRNRHGRLSRMQGHVICLFSHGI
jgi:hypothetical protein